MFSHAPFLGEFRARRTLLFAMARVTHDVFTAVLTGADLMAFRWGRPAGDWWK